MDLNRRHFIGISATGLAGALAMPTRAMHAAPLTSALGRDATQYGVHPGSPDDQTRALQRAIDEVARARVPLALPSGVYRTSMLHLQSGTQLVGVRDTILHPINAHELAVEFAIEATSQNGGVVALPYVQFFRLADDGSIASLRDYFRPMANSAPPTAAR